MRRIGFILSALFLSGGFVNAQNISNCGSDEQAKLERAKDPVAYDAAKSAFEAQWNQYFLANDSKKKLSKTQEKYIIPVVVHIFHNGGSENLSDAQVNNIIADLNKYYSADASLTGQVRPVFKDLIANTNFEFRLAKKDPHGNCTSGIVRIQTPLTSKGSQDLKALSVWDTKKYLNIWTTQEVYNGGRLVGGFATLPYGVSAGAGKDGLMVNAIQSTSGNTVPHEIGHYLGLIHPFEGSETDSCGDNDGVLDTPPTYFKYASGPVNSGRGDYCANKTYNSCGSDNPDLPDMQENIMDYFDGSCSGKIFTLGQYDRMLFCLQNYRPQLWQTENLIATGVNDGATCPNAPIADFYMSGASGNRICSGNAVTFKDNSYNATGTAWLWNFGDGANPPTSTLQNPPVVTYSTPGNKTVSLTVTGVNGSNTSVKENYLYAEPISVAQTGDFNTADWDYQNDFLQKGWYFENEVEGGEWERVTSVKYDGIASLRLDARSTAKIFNYSLISPSFDLSGGAEPYIYFRYAFAPNLTTLYILDDQTGKMVATTGDSQDGLTVYVSTDCGKTWLQRHKVSGSPNSNKPPTANPMSTLPVIGGYSGVPSTVTFTPTSKSHWDSIIVKGTTLVPAQSQVRFKITFNAQGGNNFYLDNMLVGKGNVGLNDVSKSELKLKVYPNPVAQSATISYVLPAKADMKINVYDMLGKEVATLFDGNQESGRQEVIFDRSYLKLNTGVYFVKMMVNGNTTATQKVVIAE